MSEGGHVKKRGHAKWREEQKPREDQERKPKVSASSCEKGAILKRTRRMEHAPSGVMSAHRKKTTVFSWQLFSWLEPFSLPVLFSWLGPFSLPVLFSLWPKHSPPFFNRCDIRAAVMAHRRNSGEHMNEYENVNTLPV